MTPARRSGRWHRLPDRGSVAVELVGLLPLVLVAAVLFLNGLAAVATASMAEDAARAAARAAADDEPAMPAAQRSLPGWLDGRIDTLTISQDGSIVTAELELSVPVAASAFSGQTVVATASFEER